MSKRYGVLLVLLLAVACGREGQEPAAAPATPAPSAVSSGTTSTTTGSCVELYSLDNLKKRAYAFDGVVAKIDKADTSAEAKPDNVTFTVSRWYKGGSGTTAVRKATAFTTITSAGGSPHNVGQRLLVTGDEDFVWECGFTQPYSASVAAQWEQAFKA